MRDYVLSPDGTKAYVLDWGRERTYEYDLRSFTSREVELGPTDLSSMQRLAP